MKNRIKNILIAFFFSIEFLCLCICSVFFIVKAYSVYTKVSDLFFSKFELTSLAIQIGIPLALLGLSYRQVHSILQPNMDLKEFYNWPDYLKLKDTFIAGLIWNSTPILTTLAIIFLFPNLSNSTKGFLYVATVLSSTISTITILFASQRIKEVIERDKPNINPKQ